VISSREYEDHQNVRDCIDNATTIEKYAREAQLWLHEEIFGEDQVLRDVKFYVTDGSFTVKTTGAMDIITSEQTLRDAGEGTGGIVLVPRNPTDQVLGIHIKSDKPQPGMNAYTWELRLRGEKQSSSHAILSPNPSRFTAAQDKLYQTQDYTHHLVHSTSIQLVAQAIL
jgi:hypothetical protein